MDFQKIIDTRN